MAAVVMLIEDSYDVRWLVRFHLEHAGFTVVEPTGWTSLLDRATWTGVDVAVIDLHLGDPDINGAHVLLFLRDNLPEIRRVVFTASIVEDLADPAYMEALNLGDVFVSKYDVADELVKAVRG